MSRKAIVLIVVIVLGACGLISACGLGMLFLLSPEVSPAGETIDSPAAAVPTPVEPQDSPASVGPESPEGPSDAPLPEGIAALMPTRDAPPASAMSWEDLLALRADDPALAELYWVTPGRTVFNYAAGYGIDFNSTGRVSQLTLYAGHDRERWSPYAGELPYGLVWGDTVNSVSAKLPRADGVAYGERLIWDRGSLGPYRIELMFFDRQSHEDFGDILLSVIFITP